MLRVMLLIVASAAPFTELGPQPKNGGVQAAPRSTAEESVRNMAGSGVDHCRCATTSKPRLTVWTSSACRPCRQFWRDLDGDRAFHDAMLSHFQVQWVDFDAYRAVAAARGITSAPTFNLSGRQITGYEGKQWLWQKLIALASDVPISPTSTTEPVSRADASSSDASIPPLAPLLRPRNAETSSPSSAPGTLSKRPSPTTHEPAPQSRQTAVTPRDPVGRESLWNRLRSGIHRSVPFALSGLEVAGILGGTAATGGLGTIAFAAFWRLLRRRRLGKQVPWIRLATLSDAPNAGEEADREVSRAPFPRRLDEARQLLALRQSEGRVATLDALRGMFLDDELAKLTSSGNDVEASIANSLKTAIDARVEEVAPLSTTLD